MIIGKNFFISEMPKTGTTFLRNYFKQYNNVKLSSHHDTLDEHPNFNFLSKKYRRTIRNCIIGTIFSRWSFTKKSPLFADLVSRRLKFKD